METNMTLQDAASKISASQYDLSAKVAGNRIIVSRYGRPAGYVSADEIERLGGSPTGWGKHLNKGALEVWRALTA